MKNIFRSLIVQLNSLFDLPYDQIESVDVMVFRNELIKLLEIISKKLKPNEKLIIMLDSIDQLTKADYDIKWMIFNLPSNVKMIYSTLPDFPTNETAILQRIKAKLDFRDSNYLKIDTLFKNTTIEIMNKWLADSKRQLSELQWKLIDNCFSSAQYLYPLYVKLVFDLVSKWTSRYKPDNEFLSCITIKDSIKYLFNQFERLYGKVLFSRCIFYLTIFENGISESELEDILSIDDEVLTNINQYHEAPIRRFPLSLWIRIKHDLKDYLTEKESDGMPVVSWFHRTFIESSYEVYNDIFEPSAKRDELLFNIIDYFTEKWNERRSDGTAGLKKPFKYSDRVRAKKLERSGLEITDELKEKLSGSEAYRNTKAQKSVFKYGTNEFQLKIYNHRKLNELLPIILKLHNNRNKVEALKHFIYFDYQFMHSKAELGKMDFIINTHDEIARLYELSTQDQSDLHKKEVVELYEASMLFKENYLYLHKFPNMFTLISSKMNRKSKLIKQFTRDSIADCALVPYNINWFTKEDKIDVFLSESEEKIIEIARCLNSPVLFVLTCLYDNEKVVSNKIRIVNAQTQAELGELELSHCIGIFCPFLNKPIATEVTKVSEFDGGIIYKKLNTVYFLDFMGTTTVIKKFDFRITRILLLTRNHLYLGSKKHLEIFDRNLNETIFSIDLADQVYDVITNLPKSTTYIPDFEEYSPVFVLMCKHVSENDEKESVCFVYKLTPKTNEVTLISKFGADMFVSEFLIDRAFIIDSKVLGTKSTTTVDPNILLKTILYDDHKSVFKILEIRADTGHQLDSLPLKAVKKMQDFYNDKFIYSSQSNTVIADFGEFSLLFLAIIKNKFKSKTLLF